MHRTTIMLAALVLGLVALAIGSRLPAYDQDERVAAASGRQSSSLEAADARFEPLDGRMTLVVEGIPPALLDRWQRGPEGASDGSAVLRVFPQIADRGSGDLPPFAGAVERSGTTLRFRPRVAPAAGLTYRVELGPPAEKDGQPARVFAVALPATVAPPRAHVVAIHPASEILPANLLRFYVTFSEPVETWRPYDHIRLVDEATGEVVNDVFHTAAVDLWDRSRTRFTVLFDPGRVKRGLRNHVEMGPPLAVGGRYRLEIADTWPDARGVPLARSSVKRFLVTEADRAVPSPADWHVRPPRSGGREPLIVELGGPLDHALLARSLALIDREGASVPGRGVLAPDDSSWHFEPDRPWAPGTLRLRVDPRLEDLAGNNLDRLFDTDLESDSDPVPRPRQLEIPIAP